MLGMMLGFSFGEPAVVVTRLAAVVMVMMVVLVLLVRLTHFIVILKFPYYFPRVIGTSL